MSNIKINPRGIEQLLKEQGVRDDLERRAHRIAAAAGDGHKVDSQVGSKRARAAVITDGYEAARREARSKSLTSAVDAAR